MVWAVALVKEKRARKRPSSGIRRQRGKILYIETKFLKSEAQSVQRIAFILSGHKSNKVSIGDYLGGGVPMSSVIRVVHHPNGKIFREQR